MDAFDCLVRAIPIRPFGCFVCLGFVLLWRRVGFGHRKSRFGLFAFIGLRYGRRGFAGREIDSLLGPFPTADERHQAARGFFVVERIDQIVHIVGFGIFVPIGQAIVGRCLYAVVEIVESAVIVDIVGVVLTGVRADRIAERVDAARDHVLIARGACSEGGQGQGVFAFFHDHLRAAEVENVVAHVLALERFFSDVSGGKGLGGFERIRLGGAGRFFFVLAQRLADLEQQLVCGRLVGHLLPVDDAVDEIDRLVVARIGQQDAAIEHGRSAIVDEFRLEADRRLIGEDLHVVVGNAAEHGAARHVRQADDQLVMAAFLGQVRADILYGRILDPVGEVEQHGIGAEVVEPVGFEIVDVGIVAIAEQAGPMVVGAHLHAPLVLADGRRRGLDIGIVLVDIVVDRIVRFMRAEIAA